MSSSFVVGTMWTYADGPFSDSGCGFSDDELLACNEALSYELPELGSVYPESTVSYWEAL